MAIPIQPEPDSQDVVYAVAEAVALHPPGTIIDTDGNPVGWDQLSEAERAGRTPPDAA